MRLLFLLILVGCSGSLHLENDIGVPFRKTKDEYFTHGTKFSYFKEDEKEKETYSIGQNIYTPSTKKKDSDVEILKKDRPFAGWLYGEYRDAWYSSENVKDIWGIQLGCSGPCSGARQTQQQVHRYLKQNVPYWDPDFTLKNEPGFILERERYYGLYSNNNNTFDFVGYGAAKFGNIIDSAALGLDFRYGYSLDKFPSDPIIFKLPEKSSDYTAYLFARGESRFVPYNHFLDGSLFHKEPHTVESEPMVQEGDLGFTIGYKNFKFTYRYTVFSSEWTTQKGGFSFGGIDFSW